MSGVAPVNPKIQFTSSTGAPLANGTVTVYLAGTTTPTDTWQNKGQTVLNTNPITLDANGRCDIWLDSAVTYKFLLKNAGGVTQWTVDNISGALSGADLAASSGSSLIGFIAAGTGSTARITEDKLRETVTPTDFGAVGNGVTDDTTALQNFITASTGRARYVCPPDTYLTGKLTVPDNSRIEWLPGTTLKAKSGLNDSVIVNGGASGVVWTGHLKVDGDYLNQTTGNGITFSGLSDSRFGVIEANNCRGHGAVFSECNRNIIADFRGKSNGKAIAGYGLYIYNSSDNEVQRARVDDNCIGIAVEASGSGKSAVRNTLAFVKARSNRMDYSQSGAGVHFEESAGGNAGDNVVVYPDCRNSTGVGINLTDVDNIRVIEPVIRDNQKTGLSALQCLNIQVIGGEFIGNATTEGAGYRAQMRFDDSGLTGCTGRVIGTKASGSENAVKTFTTGCAMQFIGCDLVGTVDAYSLAGTNDSVSGPNPSGVSIEPRKPMFRAGRTTTAAAGVILFDSEIMDTRSNYDPATGVFTVAQAGTYAFAATAIDAAGARIVIQLQRNGSTVAEASNVGGAATESGATIPATPVLCAANDTIRINLAVGSAAAGNDKTYFCGFFLG